MLSRIAAGVSFREQLTARGEEAGATVKAKPIAGVVTFGERLLAYSMTLRAKQIRLDVDFWGNQRLELRLFQERWRDEATGQSFTGRELADFCIEVLIAGPE